MTQINPREVASEQLKKICDKLGIEDEVYEMLRQHERIVIVKVPYHTPDGKLHVTVGYRAQHNSALGPYKGGVRYHRNVTLDEVKALSMRMTRKNSLAGLPYGGGKGGVVVPKEVIEGARKKHDPARIKTMEEISRNYFRAISPFVGVDLDIPAPDVYTNPQVMARFLDEYQRYTGQKVFGVVTAKPIELGGGRFRGASTGRSTAVAAREAANALLGGIEGKTVSIQGFGNAGQYAAKFLAEFGAKIVAVSDSKGGVYDPNGLDVEKLIQVKKETGSVVNYPGGKKISSDEPLFLDVDILVPAALEGVITKDNADKVKAKIISEAANGPITPEADEILVKKGTFVIPDILANSGGVIGSYLERVQNRIMYRYGAEREKKEIEKKIVENVKKILDRKDEFGGDGRMAAYAIAVERVVNAMKLRGRI